MKLADKNCTMSKKGTLALVGESLDELKNEINSEWSFTHDRTRLFRSWKFKNFESSLELVNKISILAEEQRHHPDINFGWGYLNIEITTHSIQGLVESDFILAAKIDSIN